MIQTAKLSQNCSRIFLFFNYFTLINPNLFESLTRMHRTFLAKTIKNKNQALVVYFMERMNSKFCKSKKSHFRAAAQLLLFPCKEIAPLFSALFSSLLSKSFAHRQMPNKHFQT
jgi:hypothetical protein